MSRILLTEDQIKDSVKVIVNFTATLLRGGETSGSDEHTQTVGEPVTDALIVVQVASPDGQFGEGHMQHTAGGIYTLTLETPLLGNYNVSVIASDQTGSGQYNNSEYVITTEHSFFISPDQKPQKSSGKYYIQLALDELYEIKTEYCPSNNNCSWDKNTQRDIEGAISLLETALTYFEKNDGDHLKSRKGLNFYDNITDAVNDLYSYLTNPDYGGNILNVLNNLKEGSWRLAVIARDDALEPGVCQESNCEELIKNANAELGKALDDSKQNNYVYIFNHLTNAWKFAMNVMGANLKKDIGLNNHDHLIPSDYDLGQNFPNPFNPSTTINFQLPEKKHVSLKIYDIQGTLVTTLVDREMEAGYHTTNWDASGYASGVYFYRFTSGSFNATKRLLLLK
jgi:hypothetical protein